MSALTQDFLVSLFVGLAIAGIVWWLDAPAWAIFAIGWLAFDL